MKKSWFDYDDKEIISNQDIYEYDTTVDRYMPIEESHAGFNPNVKQDTYEDVCMLANIGNCFDYGYETMFSFFEWNTEMTMPQSDTEENESMGNISPNSWGMMHSYFPFVEKKESNAGIIGVVIDADHGGKDHGAVNSDMIAKEYTLKISQYMADRFKELRVPFAMTRNTDETLSNEERVKRMMNPFGDVSNVIVISNHIDGIGEDGAEVIYALRNTPDIARKIVTELENAGRKTKSYHKKVLPDDMTKDFHSIMRDTQNLQVIVVKYACLNNVNDALLLQKDWNNYAEAMVKAIVEHMGLSYILPKSKTFTYEVQKGDTLFSIAQTFHTTVEIIKNLNHLLKDTIHVGQKIMVPETKKIPSSSSGNIVYVVEAGDTLWSIAKKYKTSVSELKKLNHLSSDLLSIGQHLLIPQPSIKTPTTVSITHTVKAGDTLWALAKMYNTTVDAIKQLNHLTSDHLSIGQTLEIPISQDEKYKMYTVVAGDTLWSLAKKYNTSVEAIKKANNLATDMLQIGQKLIIPEIKHMLMPTGNDNVYIVKAGDTLWSLAQKYNTTVDSIKHLNHLINDHLSIGQSLQIPTTDHGKYDLYTVVAGDTLWSIAQKYQTSVDAIKEANHLLSDMLQIGQKLVITKEQNKPMLTNNPNIYVVKAGDTLWSLAQKYNTTVDTIKHLNHLLNDNLSIGQPLQMPINQEKEVGVHIVKAGDTLWAIAQKYHISVDALKKANNLLTDLLQIGQKIIVPKENKSHHKHVVKSGDTLSALAQKYNTTVEAIMQANEFISDNLSIAKSLQLLKDKDGKDEMYIVKAGDTLWSIAKKHHTSVDALKKANNLTTDLLQIGQKLIIPKQNKISKTSAHQIYVVEAGDTLWSLAQKYNTTVDAIKQLNHLTTDHLSIGQLLQMPIKKEDKDGMLTITMGDTLWSIAQKHHTTIDALKKVNNLATDMLHLGQKLVIPKENNISKPASSHDIYEVEAGDTLWSIAKKHNTTVDSLIQANDLPTDMLQIGQKLFIPKENHKSIVTMGNNVYMVEAGDTLWSIANKFKSTVKVLKQINNLDSDELSIGQHLLVPNTPMKIPKTVSTLYIVQKGDTLSSIAKKYQTTVDAIKHANNLTSDTLQIGQSLRIPVSKSEKSITYTVVPGDTLWSIAKKYHITVDAIKHVNNLTSDRLSIGQVLQIPASKNKEHNMHTVIEGDTLWSIAKKYDTSVNAIKHLNKLTSDTLTIGQELEIPMYRITI